MERLPEFIANHLFLVSLLVALLVLLLWNIFGADIAGIRQWNAAEATQLMNREHAVLLDVRSAQEFEAGHILGALNIPEAELGGRSDELEKHRERPVIVCCQSGAASMRAARVLRFSKFANVGCLRGGLAAWQNANLPLTRGAQA
jgi:rhodanese-related sulfurtransferase